MILSLAFPVPVLKTFDYRVAEGSALSPEEWLGRRVLAPFGPRTALGVVTDVLPVSSAEGRTLKPILRSIDEDDPALTPELLALARWLSFRTVCSLGEAAFALLPAGKPGAAAPAARAASFHEEAPPRFSSLHLTASQAEAVAHVHAELHRAQPKPILVAGVAAAGKTEVYLNAVDDALALGRHALIVVPEVGLAVQMAETVRKRFGPASALLWHGDKTPKERVADWWRVRRGEVPIVVGARSGILAPLGNLGVIVLDEEHDPTLKEERKPRFHARDVALERARIERGLALLGSATPSLETHYEVKEGRIDEVRLTERAAEGGALPSVHVVDLKAQKLRGGVLSAPLEGAIEQRLKAEQQTILFLNRRGFHRFVRCPECGWVARCVNCAVALVQHKGPPGPAAADPALVAAAPVRAPAFKKGKRERKPLVGKLVCHLCGQTEAIPTTCPTCGHAKLSSGGTGTERVAEEVHDKFPWAKVHRWDSDSAAKRGDHAVIYERFARGEIDVLVGTQLVAQGFHFPRVTLVGIVDADSSLFLPDFRSAERTFQFIAQVAGRAGREMMGGDVIIQTRHADHYAVALASTWDGDAFAEREMAFRAELNYPPFTHLVEVQTRRGGEKSEAELTALCETIGALPLPALVGILGPTPASGKVKGAARWRAIFKVPLVAFEPFLAALREQLGGGGGSKFIVDVDPT